MMQVLTKRYQTVLLTLACITLLSLSTSTLLVRSAQAQSAGTFRRGDVLCGKVSSAWLPGQINKRGRFVPYTKLIKKLRKKVKAASKTNRKALRKRLRLTRRKHASGVALCKAGIPSPTATATPTSTPINTPTATPTNTPTATPTDTPTETPIDTPTETPTDTPTPTPTPEPGLQFELDGVAGLLLQNNSAVEDGTSDGSNLIGITDAGEKVSIVKNQKDTVRVSNFLIAPNDKLYVVLTKKFNLDTAEVDLAGGCLLVEVDRATGQPTCIDAGITSVAWFENPKNQSIQFDDLGGIYYVARNDNFDLNIRMYRDGIHRDIFRVDDSTSIKDFLVLGDGTILFHGKNGDLIREWVRRFSPNDGFETILSTDENPEISFMRIFPDGRPYFGGYFNGLENIVPYSQAAKALDYQAGTRLTPEDIYSSAGTYTRWRTPGGFPNLWEVSGTKLALGQQHSCSVSSEGGVTCWGRNSVGQLGDGTNIDTVTRVEVVGLQSGVREVFTQFDHTCALTQEGGVKCWGINNDGQLGDGTTTSSNTPVDVVGLQTGVQQLALGEDHTCALTTGGGVKCWGDNRWGQLGNGTSTSSTVPVDVSGLQSGVVRVTAGSLNNCALTIEGGVKCWGATGEGFILDGTNARYYPEDIVGLQSGVKDVVSGGFHSCALTTSGGVKCWGDNDDYQLGDGTKSYRATPVNALGLESNVELIVAGRYHSCALTTAGAVKCWGDNDYGQLGNGRGYWVESLGYAIGLKSGVTKLFSGGYHSCAETDNEILKCWGNNKYGQLLFSPEYFSVYPRSLQITEYGEVYGMTSTGLTRYFAYPDLSEVSLTDPTLLSYVSDDFLAVTGKNDSGKYTTILVDLLDYFETMLIDPAKEEFEVFHAEYSPEKKIVMFTGRRVADDTHVVGQVNLDTMEVTSTPIDTGKPLEFIVLP